MKTFAFFLILGALLFQTVLNMALRVRLEDEEKAHLRLMVEFRDHLAEDLREIKERAP